MCCIWRESRDIKTCQEVGEWPGKDLIEISVCCMLNLQIFWHVSVMTFRCNTPCLKQMIIFCKHYCINWKAIFFVKCTLLLSWRGVTLDETAFGTSASPRITMPFSEPLNTLFPPVPISGCIIKSPQQFFLYESATFLPV